MKRVAVVTGATGGIGRWIALGLAGAGHHVVLVCRDAGRGAAVQGWIAGQVPGASTSVRVADLAQLRAARAVGRAIAAEHGVVAVLVNNAGMFAARRTETAEGHEAVLALNHLAPYVLADALEPALLAAAAGGAAARIVNVGSSTSDRARIDPDDLEGIRRWGYLHAYGQSKLALLIATRVRAVRLTGTGVVANTVHPGTVATGLIREAGPIGWAWRLMRPFVLTERQGADTPLHVATSPDWAGRTGEYVKRRNPAAPNRRALDPALAAAVEARTRALIARTL